MISLTWFFFFLLKSMAPRHLTLDMWFSFMLASTTISLVDHPTPFQKTASLLTHR